MGFGGPSSPQPQQGPPSQAGRARCPGVALSTWALRCLADRGTVQKVIVLPRDDMETEELMLEEIEVFKVRAGMSTTLLSVLDPANQPLGTPASPLRYQSLPGTLASPLGQQPAP